MAAKPIPEDEVMQMAEEMRSQFLKDYSDSGQFDSRDLHKLRTNLEHVAKFVRHQRGNYDNALNNMVESLKWRHSFGVNDIQFEDIEDYLWRSGMAYTHGVDKIGNNIVILNIRIHRKDSKKSLSLQRWIAFCFEAHRRAYPMGKMCMIFDMTGCGLSQMDMELIRFIVNCFKIYWPDLLHILLVYNMPWILQAAWKIVQTWLSEGAVAKVKFVNSDTILEYVNSEQLIVGLGGSDPWTFDYEKERRRMLNQAKEVLERERREREGESDGSQTHSNETHSSDMEQDPSGMESVEVSTDQVEDGGAVGVAMSGGDTTDKKTDESIPGEGRKVRFSSNLPPTRQSRYGHDRDEERVKMSSPDNQQLLKGSAASHGFRRRQVHKLITRQNDTKTSLSTERQNSDSSPFTHIQLSPPKELLFIGSRDNELHCTLTLSNVSEEAALFKIKTTAPRRYKVRPNLALILGKSVSKVQVLLVPGSPNTSISDDKFLVQIYSFSSPESVPPPPQYLPFWRALSDRDITEHRMRCRWVQQEVALTPSSPTQSTSDTLPQPSSPTSQALSPQPAHSVVTLTQRDIRNNNDKLDKLVRMNQDLSKRLQSLYYWTILILLGLLVILIVIIVL